MAWWDVLKRGLVLCLIGDCTEKTLSMTRMRVIDGRVESTDQEGVREAGRSLIP